MRLRALLATTGIAATAAMTALPTPAFAGPPTPTPAVVRSATGTSAPFTGIDLTTCSGTNTGSAATVSQSSGSHGSGALRVALGSNADSNPLLYKDYGSTPVLATDFTVSYDLLKQGTAAAANVLLDIVVDADGSDATLNDIDDLYYELAPDSTTVWRHADPLGSATLDDGSQTGITWANYLTAHPAAAVLGFSLDIGCGSAPAGALALIDNLTMNTTSTTASAFDFEPTSTISVAVGGATAPSGYARTLSAVLKSGSTILTNRTVEFWAKPYGASSYSLLGTRVTDASGMVFLTVRPTVQTAYYLKYAGSEPSVGAAQSAVQTVYVSTRITKNIYDTTVTTAQTIQAYGLTSPAKPGTYVYLYRGSTKVATARVASDGTYLLQTRITTKGNHSLKVLGAAGSGNVSGTSAATTVTVS